MIMSSVWWHTASRNSEKVGSHDLHTWSYSAARLEKLQVTRKVTWLSCSVTHKIGKETLESFYFNIKTHKLFSQCPPSVEKSGECAVLRSLNFHVPLPLLKFGGQSAKSGRQTTSSSFFSPPQSNPSLSAGKRFFFAVIPRIISACSPPKCH